VVRDTTAGLGGVVAPQQLLIPGIGTLPQSLPICMQHACSSAVFSTHGVISHTVMRSAVVSLRRHIEMNELDLTSNWFEQSGD